MKIRYIIGKPPIKVVSKWSEILNYQDTEWSFSKEYYDLYKTLEVIDILWTEIKISRKNLNIPLEGYSWDKFIRIFNDATNPKILKEILRIRNNLDLADCVNIQLKNLIIGNFVEPTKKPILDSKFYFWRVEPGKEYSFEPSREQKGVACISIFHNVSKEEFKKYLDKKWPVIKKELKKLKDVKTYGIKKRELEILKAKNIKGKIAKQIEIKRIKGKGNVNVGTGAVHKIYERTIKKIIPLVQLKNDVKKIK